MNSVQLEINEEELVFALDIGTRTVIGIVGAFKSEGLEILASEIMEHEERAMYDGQIHNINSVAKIVKKVKEKLEKELNIKLKRAAIAAAGRALKTYRVRKDRETDITVEIDRRQIESLEMEAIQDAQEILDNNKTKNESKYYCVGYTVINYYLDNNFIENLEGHRGSKIGVDVVATFLPHVVVDSLYTVMNRVDLEVDNITLEPIAAIDVAIKKDLRLLNLALVDIGAGTSDIAITKDGTIVAYAMASVAGDEITETIAKKYLLDYSTAEKLKVELDKNDTHSFYDAVGIKHEYTTEEILNNIEEAIKKLAKEICDNIIKYNEKSPSAVFLIGGGSQIPRLTKYIAEYMDLPKERVVVRKSDIVENIDGLNEKLEGPQSITPIGIAMKGANDKYKDFLEVIVNGEKVKLFNSKKIKVSDALVLIGYNPRKLVPKRGKNLTFYINNEQKLIKGELGEPAKIFVNRKESNLEHKLKSGDEVKVIDATEGKAGSANIYDYIKMNKKITFNHQEISNISEVKINGKKVNSNVDIEQNDRIEVSYIDTIDELLNYYNIDKGKVIVYKNDEIVDGKSDIEENDYIELEYKKNATYKSINQAKQNKTYNTISLTINGELKSFKYEKSEFVFVDIFNNIDFDISRPKGLLILKVNGEKASYHQKLKDGDEIEIFWQES